MSILECTREPAHEAIEGANERTHPGRRLRIVWRQGFLRVSIDEIAARAGITKRALYLHFRSKDDLIAAALAHSSQLAVARLKEFPRPTRRKN